MTILPRPESSPSCASTGSPRVSLPNGSPARWRHHRLSSTSNPTLSSSARSSDESLFWSDASTDLDTPLTPPIDTQSVDSEPKDVAELDVTKTHNEHASTTLVTQDPKILNDTASDGQSGTELIQKYCCGGGCCFLNAPPTPAPAHFIPLELPNNDAFRSLKLKIGPLTQDTELTGIPELPPRTVSFSSLQTPESPPKSSVDHHPPPFVKPHPPYDVFSAPLYSARELTNKGAEKRTFHFDIDVTDYPEEGDVDFKVGGAIGVCPPNKAADVDELFEVLGVPRFLRDKIVTLGTSGGRWPTIWGDEKPRLLPTTRRELLTWCSDIQSYPPTKQLLRVMAEYATAANEKKILLYLCSAQGQPAFCDLRTGPHLSILQLLHAFPSSKPPLADLLSVLSQLMPRFYSLSNDPHVSSAREGLAGRRLIEIAVTVHESPNWRSGPVTGVGSGFLERVAQSFIERSKPSGPKLDLRIPMFRGLMANPLSREFGASDGPMLLIGAGVGMAPFRGFILNRLRNANCAQKIWLIQGVRDASIDELYSGELGAYEHDIKKVVQSRGGRGRSRPNNRSGADPHGTAHNGERRGSTPHFQEPHGGTPESRYVQDEVRQQSDVVWDIIRSVDGRVFVCGSSKGMGEGVEAALRQVAMKKTGWSEDAAGRFWEEMRDAGKYIAETW